MAKKEKKIKKNKNFPEAKSYEPNMGAEVLSILSGLAVMVGGLFLPWLAATEDRQLFAPAQLA